MGHTPLHQGDVLNQRYLIQEALGQGGMGTVYKAEHVRLHAVVAVKEIRAPGGEEAQSRMELDRCEHEARFLVHLNHPHLPKVTDAFIEKDNFYLVMEYIEGVTLEARQASAGGAALDVLQSVEWALQIADVLAYLHCQEPPIIFRDLKPSNVMVQPDGNIKLIDFGIARHFQPGASKDTSLLGSVGYSPPEQFGKGQTDQRSDVYAFGATLHHLLTGRDPAMQPFKFPPARTFNPLVPDSLSHLLDMCLAMDPNDRPESINVVAVQLLGAREELTARRTQLAAQQAALAANGMPLPRTAENGAASGGDRIPDGAGTSRSDSRRSEGGREPGSGAIRITAANSAKSGVTASSSQRPAVWLLLPILLVIIGACAAIVVNSHKSDGRGKQSGTSIVTPPVTIETNSGPPKTTGAPETNAGTPIPNTSGGNGAVNLTPPTSGQPIANPNINLQTALLKVTGDMLPITVSGTVRGQMNTQVQLGVYFFDADGKPLNAIDTSNPVYINDQRYLCVYETLAINADDYTLGEALSIPTHLLSGASQPGPYTYQAILFLNGKPLGETARIALPASAYGGTANKPVVENPPPPNSPLVIREGARHNN